MEEVLYFKDSGGEIFIKAHGHVSAAGCPELKLRVFSRLEKTPPVTGIWFDLSSCEYMDSTFLGLIVGVNKRFKSLTGKTIVILHANQACLGLLRLIGVTRLVEISEENKAFPAPMDPVGPASRASAEFILDAHEALSEISQENKDRFSTLTKTLKESLDKKRD